LPAEMGGVSGMTCWRRLHQVLHEEPVQADSIDWDRAALDSAAVPAPGLPPAQTPDQAAR
jgi:hypothetical protein